VHVFEPGKPYWWQWPTILSFDAPSVAVAWQWMFARAAGARLEWYHYAIIFAAVWIIYAADRWLEGWRLRPDQVKTQRHYFYQRHRWPLFALWLAVMAAGLGLALTRLTLPEIRCGFILLAPVILYTFSHQFLHRHHPWRAPKEICVAVLFAIGVVCFTLARNPSALAIIAVPLALFSLLCLANCALISIWEDEVDRSHGQTSLALQYPGVRRFVHLLPWLAAAAALASSLDHTGGLALASWCATASGILLGAVDLGHVRCGRQLSRVLADFVLLTPVLAWLGQCWWPR
jgi:hypothetical protein